MGSVPQQVHRGVMARPKPKPKAPVMAILMVSGAVIIVGVFLLWWTLGAEREARALGQRRRAAAAGPDRQRSSDVRGAVSGAHRRPAPSDQLVP